MPTASKPKKSKSQTRIDAARKIIEKTCFDPACKSAGVCKHEGEKAAARAYLKRVMDNVAKHREAPQDIEDDHARREAGIAFGTSEYAAMWREIYAKGYDEHGNSYFIGSKHHMVRGARYAEAVRAEVRLIRKLARYPLVQDASADQPVGQRLALYRFDPIGQAPADVKISVTSGRGWGSSVEIVVKAPIGWGWTGTEATNSRGETYTDYKPTAALEELGAELRRVASAYNRSYGTNLMTDCFTDAFDLSVSGENPRYGYHTSIG